MIKNGTKVKVTADTAFHGFKLGSTVTIIEKCGDGYPDNCYRAQSEDGAIRYISNKDFVVSSNPYFYQKFYCVESYGSYFTEGKVYSVDSDGGMKYDDGYVGGNRVSIEDYFKCNSWAKGKIYPLVDRTAEKGEYVYLKQDACCKAHLAGSVVKCVDNGGRFEGGKEYHTSGVYITMDRYSVIDGYKPKIETEKETPKKPKPIFSKGDRVLVNGSMGSRKFDNLVGTVLKDVENKESFVPIEFDTNIQGHNCKGKGKEGYCYNLSPRLVSKYTYKVGDYVLLNGKSLGITWNNKTEKINHVDYGDNTLNVGSDYKWVDMKNAKPVSKPEIVRSIEIITEGTDTIAIYKENGVEVSRAVTKLADGDTYNFFKGSTRAYINLIKNRKDSKSLLKDLFDIMSGIFNPKPKIVKQDSYKVGDKVKIVDAWTGLTNENSDGEMDKWLGKTMTIRDNSGYNYRMIEDLEDSCTFGGWYWNKHCIEGKVVK